MSYARFSRDSDVYVFLSVEGYLDCCGCTLNKKGEDIHYGSFHSYTTKDMLDHLKHHRQVGDDVPDYCMESLLEDMEENDAWIKSKGVL